MAGATIDHLVAVTVFIGAILLFISLFNQTIQTAIIYQRHRYIASKCTDLLDNMLLNPGYPMNWSISGEDPTSFGLQDPEFTQYRLSPFSLMRLNYAPGIPVYYPKTGQWYSNITMGFGKSLLVPYAQAVNYSTAAKLLGVNNTFGFRLTISPVITISISEVRTNPLKVSINVFGAGFPLANANVSYCFITVKATGGDGSYPAYTLNYGTNMTDDEGKTLLDFPSFNGEEESFVIIAYAHMSGLVGVGYHENVRYTESYVVPFVADFENGTVLIAHSWDVHGGSNPAEIAYNATFILLTEDFTLREMPLGVGSIGKINYGVGKPYQSVNISTHNPGILAITYRKSAVESGIILMPWGINAMAFPVEFGDDPVGKEWVATDTRQVLVNGIAYQARLALWSLEGYQVIN